VQKIILPSVLVLAFLVLGVSGMQNAYAVIDCSSELLEAGAVYVGSESGRLHKVDTFVSPPASCEVGQMKEFSTDVDNIICQDIAIDHTDTSVWAGGQLYCLAGGTVLHKVDRTATAGIVDTQKIDSIKDVNGDVQVSIANAMEIDHNGNAYIAGLGTDAGKFWNINLSTAKATLRTDFGDAFHSSGDLAFDEQSFGDMYWTVICFNLKNTANDCGNDTIDLTRDRLFRINLNQPSGPDTLTTLAVLPEGSVFGMEFVSAGGDLCYVTVNSKLFETDTTGFVTRSSETITPEVRGFGATANLIGGTFITLNMISLAVAAAQTNSALLILLLVSGIGVVAYQFKDKIKSENKKSNEEYSK